MAIRLKQEMVDKVKADFPALNLNQIAGKYGLSWITVKKICSNGQGSAPEKSAKRRASAKTRASVNGEGPTITLTEEIARSWFAALTLEEKAALMRGH